MEILLLSWRPFFIFLGCSPLNSRPLRVAVRVNFVLLGINKPNAEEASEVRISRSFLVFLSAPLGPSPSNAIWTHRRVGGSQEYVAVPELSILPVAVIGLLPLWCIRGSFLFLCRCSCHPVVSVNYSCAEIGGLRSYYVVYEKTQRVGLTEPRVC